MAHISEKQLAANRQNCKLGGIKTEAGKEASKMNALKHGLLSKEIVLSMESEIELREIEKQLRSDLRPVGTMELLLVDRVITNTWRLRRLLGVERSTMEHQRKATDSANMATFSFSEGVSEQQNEWSRTRAMLFNEDIDKLIRYETSLERSIYRALHELQRMQAARRGEKPPAPLAVDIDNG